MLEETARVFRDENGDHLSEPEEVVLSSALTNKRESLPASIGPSDRVYGFLESKSFQDQVSRNRIIMQTTVRSQIATNQEISRAQIQAECDHKTGLGYSAMIATLTSPDGSARRICTRCNYTVTTSPEQQANSYQQQAANADQMSAYNALGQGTDSGLGGSASIAGLANANPNNSQGLTNAYGLVPSIPAEVWAQVDLLNDATPNVLESPLDGTSSPGVAGTSEDGTALTATGIRRAVDTLFQKNDLPARAGNPIQFFSQPIGYRTSLGVSSPDPKNDPIKDPMTEGEAGFQAWLLKENSTLGKIKGWVKKSLAKRKKHSQSKSLLKELLKIKAEVESLSTPDAPKFCGQCGKPDNHPECCLTAGYPVYPFSPTVADPVDASKAPFSHERYEAWRDSYSGFPQSR